MSPRTLEYAFREIFDITLTRYIKLRRLHAARRSLRSARLGDQTVLSVAPRFGFAHLGYFARDYREAFGESPSDTLRNSQG